MDQKLSYFEVIKKEIACVSCPNMVLSGLLDVGVYKTLHCFILKCL